MSKSVEHIVPESLGNKSFVLPLGYVCDKCNNYFAREVEKPFLEQIDMRLLRFYQNIPNKKNRIPAVQGIMGSSVVTVQKELTNSEIVIGITVPPNTFNGILNKHRKMQLIIPAFDESYLPAQNSITSRFLAKMALEALAERLAREDGGLDYLINDRQLDQIRNYARRGTTKEWPCNIRQIYATDAQWKLGKVTKPRR